MKAIAVALVLSALSAGTVLAQPGVHTTGRLARIVDADSASFWIDVPRGWKLDVEAGHADGLAGVLYKDGQSWRTGDPVMFIRVITPDVGYNAVIPAAIRSDSADWAGSVRDFYLIVRDDVHTVSGEPAQVRAFGSRSAKNFATVAYVQGEGRVWMIEITARSRESHDAAYADFLSLVSSYTPG